MPKVPKLCIERWSQHFLCQDVCTACHDGFYHGYFEPGFAQGKGMRLSKKQARSTLGGGKCHVMSWVFQMPAAEYYKLLRQYFHGILLRKLIDIK